MPSSIRQQCGCEVSINITYISETVELDYCPLHSAAPALLAALEETVQALESYPDESDSNEVKRARAAIAAAKGESSR